ncbi:MAG: hypothetical protein KY476_00715 [Planctomycetes bacterium]|nr:hypothetical protein [Planctomycetota bacterium]
MAKKRTEETPKLKVFQPAEPAVVQMPAAPADPPPPAKPERRYADLTQDQRAKLVRWYAIKKRTSKAAAAIALSSLQAKEFALACQDARV